MPACPRCGSRSVKIVFNPLTVVAHLVSTERRTKCPRCGWKGWQGKKVWEHVPGAGLWRGAGGMGSHPHRHKASASASASAPDGDAAAGPEAPQIPPPEVDVTPELDAIDRALEEQEHTHGPRRTRPTADGRSRPKSRTSSRKRRGLRRLKSSVERRGLSLQILAGVALLTALALVARACGIG